MRLEVILPVIAKQSILSIFTFLVLGGTLLHAQNNVFPFKPESGDPQQHLIANRSVLLMVKPLLASKSPMSVTIKARNGTTFGNLQLNSPDQLPKTAYHSGTLDFSAQVGATATVSTNADLKLLNDTRNTFLSRLLDSHTVVDISLADGRWTSNIYLPFDAAFEGKIVNVTSAAGYTTNIIGSSQYHTISRGLDYKFKLLDGVWHRERDPENNRLIYSENMWSTTLPAIRVQP